MKRGISIALIFALMFSNIQSLWIMVDFCINQDYIAEVLCINRDQPMLNCDGKCFLAEKLKEQKQKQEEEEEKSIRVEQKSIPMILCESDYLTFRSWSQQSQGQTVYSQVEIHSSDLTPPKPPPQG